MIPGTNMNAGQVRVVDPILTEHARGYSNGEFIGFELFPRVNMPTRAAKRIEFNREALMRVLTVRAPGTDIKQITMTYNGAPVNLTQDALQAITPVEFIEEAGAIPGIDLQQESVDVALAVIALSLEIQQAELARNPDAYALTNKVALTGTDKWSDGASDPGVLIEDGKETVRARTGRRANVLALSAPVKSKLKTHARIREHYKHTTSSTISDEMLASYFDVEKVVVGNAIYDLFDGSTLDVWGNDAVLAYVPSENMRNMRLPSYGYTYQLNNHPFVEAVEWNANKRSWANNVINESAPEIVGQDAGFLIQNAV